MRVDYYYKDISWRAQMCNMPRALFQEACFPFVLHRVLIPFSLLPRVSAVWHKHRKPRPISAKKRNKFWTKSCSQIFTTEESVHQAPTEQVCKSQLVIAACVSLPSSPSLPFSSWHRKLIDRLRVWFPERRTMNAHVCLLPNPQTPGSPVVELAPPYGRSQLLRGQNQYFQKIQRSTGRQQALPFMLSSLFLPSISLSSCSMLIFTLCRACL